MNLDTEAVTNAIVRLAGDMASIVSIVTAADNDTQIFTKSKEACDLLNKTATDTKKNKLPTLQQVKHIADTVNKFSAIVMAKKALNPLISDELVSIVNTAGKNANAIISLYTAV